MDSDLDAKMGARTEPQMDQTRYFRKGLGNRANVEGILQADYHSGLVEYLRHTGHRLSYGTTELRLAREFGFCYGVDRAVEYAYETCDRFPDRRIWITGEIIHNPGVNRRLLEKGIRFLPPEEPGTDRLTLIAPEDVVLIPAFGVDHAASERLRERGAILVDTTCGSVLTVWKSVERYAREGVTAVVHGKVRHEETRATCSQVVKTPGAHYAVVRDKEEAGWLCGFLDGSLSGEELVLRLRGAHSEGFRPDLHLQKIGLANQTTMLSSDSFEIAEMLRRAMARRYGEQALPERFHNFDTICSATQDRQDAVLELIEQGVDLMIVVGGFNSSNTAHLVEISARKAPTYHIEDADNLVSETWIRHQPCGKPSPVMQEGWLPSRPLIIGLTAGASTPNSEIGRALARILEFRGVPDSLVEEWGVEGSRLAAETKAAGSKGRKG